MWNAELYALQSLKPCIINHFKDAILLDIENTLLIWFNEGKSWPEWC